VFAINHAATALLIKSRFPQVRLVWLLVSVQLVEMLWVFLNLFGVERLHTESTVTSVRDIHLAHMPYSHSIASSLLIGFLAWILIAKVLKRPTLGIAVAIGIASHIVLDLVTHTRDIPLVPFADSMKLGVGLYDVPLLALVVETAYGVLCWRIFRGTRMLLFVILAFNVANLTLFVPAIQGPEGLFANRAEWLVLAIAAQIVATLALVWYFSRQRSLELEAAGN
jgi:membrane-bound metal-dependent hydrolase YbcI (DUF457 family)